MPVEPPPSPWVFPDPCARVGTDARTPTTSSRWAPTSSPGTLLAAYRGGLFPMPDAGDRRRHLWWSPVARGVLPLDGLRVSRSLRQSVARMEIRVDTAFAEVVAACADPARDGGWIDADFVAAYTELHELGWAHSVEAWRDGELVGGLYGVAIGGLFAGESMFHRAARRLEGRAGRTGRAALRRVRRPAAARRAVADPPPGVAGRHRGRAPGVPVDAGACSSRAAAAACSGEADAGLTFGVGWRRRWGCASAAVVGQWPGRRVVVGSCVWPARPITTVCRISASPRWASSLCGAATSPRGPAGSLGRGGPTAWPGRSSSPWRTFRAPGATSPRAAGRFPTDRR